MVLKSAGNYAKTWNETFGMFAHGAEADCWGVGMKEEVQCCIQCSGIFTEGQDGYCRWCWEKGMEGE